MRSGSCRGSRPHRRLCQELITRDDPTLLRPRRRNLPFQRAARIFPLRTGRKGCRGRHPKGPSPGRDRRVVPCEVFVKLMKRFTRGPPNVLLRGRVRRQLSALSMDCMCPDWVEGGEGRTSACRQRGHFPREASTRRLVRASAHTERCKTCQPFNRHNASRRRRHGPKRSTTSLLVPTRRRAGKGGSGNGLGRVSPADSDHPVRLREERGGGENRGHHLGIFAFYRGNGRRWLRNWGDRYEQRANKGLHRLSGGKESNNC